jgi:hypothetical protein
MQRALVSSSLKTVSSPPRKFQLVKAPLNATNGKIRVVAKFTYILKSLYNAEYVVLNGSKLGIQTFL